MTRISGFSSASARFSLPCVSFSQADVDSGLVSYSHDGSETVSDSFNFTVDDGDEDLSGATGGTFAIDGHQERVGESIFLFAPSCVTVTTAGSEESASPSVMNRDEDQAQPAAPSPAWGSQDVING